MQAVRSQRSLQAHKTRLVRPAPSIQTIYVTNVLLDQLRQTVHLVALAALIKAIPKTAYAHELPTVSLLSRTGACPSSPYVLISSCPCSSAGSPCLTTCSGRASLTPSSPPRKPMLRPGRKQQLKIVSSRSTLPVLRASCWKTAPPLGSAIRLVYINLPLVVYPHIWKTESAGSGAQVSGCAAENCAV